MWLSEKATHPFCYISCRTETINNQISSTENKSWVCPTNSQITIKHKRLPCSAPTPSRLQKSFPCLIRSWIFPLCQLHHIIMLLNNCPLKILHSSPIYIKDTKQLTQIKRNQIIQKSFKNPRTPFLLSTYISRISRSGGISPWIANNKNDNKNRLE